MLFRRAFRASLEGHRLLVAVTYTLVLLSCGEPLGPESETLARIEVSPSALSLEVGTARTLVARALDNQGATIDGARIFWSTEDPTIATVSQAGLVTGNAPGSTRIAGSSRGKSAIVPVTVAALPVTLVRVTPASAKLQVGATLVLRAQPFNSAGDSVAGREALWTSASEGVATVAADGTVTGVARGVAAISATIDGATGSAFVTIEAVPVASVRVTPDSSTIYIGQASQLTATLSDAAGRPLSGRGTVWTSSDPSIASVSSTGLVNALSPGVVTITASSEGKSGTARVTASRVPVDLVRITPSAVTTTIGQRVELAVRMLDSAGNELSGRPAHWTSDAPSVATVDGAGVVTAISSGRAIVTATSDGRSGTATIDVTPIPVASLVVQPTPATLSVGTVQQFVATPLDAQGEPLEGRVVTWLSGAPSVATVSSNGVVTAVGVGTVLIIATSEGQSATATVTVTPAPVAQVSVSPQQVVLNPDSARQFLAIARDARGNVLTGRPTSWTSTNRSVASVNATGRVTAVAPGSSRISATVEGIVGGADVTVALVPVARVALSPDSTTVVEGGSTRLVPLITDSLGHALSGRALSWTSSDLAVATVSALGVVTAVAPGSTKITATALNAGINRTSPSATATVVVSYAPVATVRITPVAPSVTPGGTTQLTATLESAPPAIPLSAAGRTVTWSIADASIATISASGLATGIAPGTTTITLTASSPGQVIPVIQQVTLTVSLVPIAYVVIAPLAGSVHVGSLYARAVSAQAFDAANNPLPGRTITWRTTDPARLAVSPASSGSGLTTLTALVAPASSIGVIASAPGASGTVADTLVVSTDLVPIAAIGVAPLSATLNPQQTQALSATVRDSAGNVIGTAGGNPLAGRTATWSSANTAVGTVNATGVVTAVGFGTTTISASSGAAIPGTFSLSVVPVPVASVAVSAADSTISVGDVTQGNVVARDAAGNVLTLAGRAVVWSTGSATVATVSATGTITAVGPGNTVIGVTVDGVGPATFALSVTSPAVVPLPVASVTIAAPDSSLFPGTSVQASVVARDTLGNALQLSGRTVAWTSRTPAVATVSASGLISAIAPGGSVIGVSVDGVGPATFSLTVTPVPVATVRVSAPDSSITVGDVVQGNVVARDSANTVLSLAGRTVTWTSSATAVASVSAAGAITAVGVGTTTIGVTVDGVGPATFTMTVSLRPVASVSVTATDSSLTTGTTAQATVVARDASNNVLSLAGRAIVWSSSTPAVATVSTSGLVTAVAPGSTTIRVTVDGVGPATFNVSVSPPSVATVSISAPDSSVTVGDAVQATAVARDAQGAPLSLVGRTIAWASSTPAVASINGSGAIAALAPGSTTIGVTIDGVGPASFVLTVAPVPVASVSVSATDSSLVTGTTAQATAVARDASGNVLSLTGRAVVWASTDAGVASVSTTGLITAVAVGSATISVTVDGVGPATIALTVAPPAVVSVTVTAPDSSLTVGDTVNAVVQARDASNNVLPIAGRTIVWTSSLPAVAAVSNAGRIAAIAPGTTTIGVTVDGVGPATFVVIVSPVPVASVSVSATDSSLTVGATAQATVVARDASNNQLALSGRSVAWSSSLPAVATVSPTGVVTAVGTGTATISVTVDGVGPATFSVVVSPPAVASVSISAPDSSVTVGDAVQATAVARDAQGAPLSLVGRTIAWASSTPAVATINASGAIAALAPGSTTIGVTIDGVGPASFVLNVAAIPVATVSISAPDSSATAGGLPIQAVVEARDAGGALLPLAGRTVAWSSTNPQIATVSTNGLITPLVAGTTTVEVTVDGVGPAQLPFTVLAVPVSVVDVAPSSAALQVGASLPVTATPRDASGNALPNRSITWTLSNAKGSANPTTGPSTTFTAVDSGVVLLSATSEGKTGSMRVSISLVPVDTVQSIPPRAAPTVTLSAGAGATSNEVFRAVSRTAGNLPGRAFTVTSSAPSLATVAPVGGNLTDTSGKGQFAVTLTASAVAGDRLVVTVDIEGKRTDWIVTVR